MTSEPVRDPLADHLLTPQNCALIIIDYQAVQVRSIRSMDRDVLVDRVVDLARFGMLYRLPVVLSTVNVSTGKNQPTIGPGYETYPVTDAVGGTSPEAHQASPVDWLPRRESAVAGGQGGGEEVDEQLGDALSLVVMDPVRRVGQALDAVQVGYVVVVGLG
jgi:hypothetical protein